MQYNLKDKIEVTDEFLNELISKSWQEADILKQQIANININTSRGSEVAKLLKNTCTSYYVLIGCLEELLCKEEISFDKLENPAAEPVVQSIEEPALESDDFITTPIDVDIDDVSEPFEYFVDFDEPIGDPISDEDLYR